MSVTVDIAKHQNGVIVFTFIGKINGSEALDDCMLSLDEQLSFPSTKGVILDLGQLEYINSAGINFLIRMLTKTRNKGLELLLANLSPAVDKLVTITKLNAIFTICASVDEAQTKLNAQEA